MAHLTLRDLPSSTKLPERLCTYLDIVYHPTSPHRVAAVTQTPKMRPLDPGGSSHWCHAFSLNEISGDGAAATDRSQRQTYRFQSTSYAVAACHSCIAALLRETMELGRLKTRARKKISSSRGRRLSLPERRVSGQPKTSSSKQFDFVVLTMAAMAFDPRLLWEPKERHHV